MKSKLYLAAMLTVATAVCPVWAQAPYGTIVPDLVSNQGAEPAPPRASRWLTPAPCLCETPNQSAPIDAEAFVRVGASVPCNSWFGSNDAVGRDAVPGLWVEAGLRTSFFNEPATRAWVVTTSLSHVSNGHDPAKGYSLRVIDFTGTTNPITGTPDVAQVQSGTPTKPFIHIRDTDRSYLNLGGGRDYYWHTTAEDTGQKLHFGWEMGARYGCLSQEYDIIKHRTDVIGGLFAALHGEIERQTCWGVWHVGVRCEYGYTWSDILQKSSDIQEINTMLEIGVRY